MLKMHEQPKDEFFKIIENLKNSGMPIIVEGKKDRAALEKIGLSNITELSKKPLFRVVEEIADSNDECAILTDLDKKGKELYGKLDSDFQRYGVKINNRLRDFLFRHTKIRQIEGITTDLEAF